MANSSVFFGLNATEKQNKKHEGKLKPIQSPSLKLKPSRGQAFASANLTKTASNQSTFFCFTSWTMDSKFVHSMLICY